METTLTKTSFLDHSLFWNTNTVKAFRYKLAIYCSCSQPVNGIKLNSLKPLNWNVALSITLPWFWTLCLITLSKKMKLYLLAVRYYANTLFYLYQFLCYIISSLVFVTEKRDIKCSFSSYSD